MHLRHQQEPIRKQEEIKRKSRHGRKFNQCGLFGRTGLLPESFRFYGTDNLNKERGERAWDYLVF